MVFSRKHIRRSLPILLLLLAIPASLFAQESVARLNWENGTLSVMVTQDVGDSGYNMPARFYRTRQNIDESISSRIFLALLDIQVNSWYTLGDIIRDDPALLRYVEEFSRTAEFIEAKPNIEDDSLTALYELNIFPGLSEMLVRHHNSFPMHEVLEWKPGNEYSGIVIYAAMPLPVHGETMNGKVVNDYAVPAMFPVIYDQNMEILIDRNRMEPEFAALWGAAAYTYSFDESAFTDRIGSNPMRILATGIFGIANADVKIPMADAEVLLASESNRRLLAEGRILIILGNPPGMQE